jgi:predicted aldo/keto reductase-like oxidoreductase
MTQLAQKLDKKLATWRPEVAAQVEQIVTDAIELADTDTLDLLPSQAVVQEVLDALDERQAG